MMNHTEGRTSLLLLSLFIILSITLPTLTIGTPQPLSTILHHPSGYIQQQIDNASSGDIIHIPSGTYHENIIINKTITLIGEHKNTTIIDGNTDTVITIRAPMVTVQGFSIQNSTNTNKISAGIMITGSHSTLSDTIIQTNNIGIYISGSTTSIKNNIITQSQDYGIYCDHVSNNIITNNTIMGKNIGMHLEYTNTSIISDNAICSNAQEGIILCCSPQNTITHNNISDNQNGIYLTVWASLGNLIQGNTISCNSGYGIFSDTSIDNTITENNFQNNHRPASFRKNNDMFFFAGNFWWHNYWGEPRIRPKIIIGTLNSCTTLSWVAFDLHPALTPF